MRKTPFRLVTARSDGTGESLPLTNNMLANMLQQVHPNPAEFYSDLVQSGRAHGSAVNDGVITNYIVVEA